MREALAFHHGLAMGAFVLIEPAVTDGLLQHRQIDPSACEAGGILLGMRRGDHIHCTAFTEPGPRDRRTRNSFCREPSHHQVKALELWHESGGMIDYLGEWHTHPQLHPTPSRIDLREWQILLKSYFSPLMFIVQGTSSQAWVGLGKKHDVRQLVPVGDLERVISGNVR